MEQLRYKVNKQLQNVNKSSFIAEYPSYFGRSRCWRADFGPLWISQVVDRTRLGSYSRYHNTSTTRGRTTTRYVISKQTADTQKCKQKPIYGWQCRVSRIYIAITVLTSMLTWMCLRLRPSWLFSLICISSHEYHAHQSKIILDNTNGIHIHWFLIAFMEYFLHIKRMEQVSKKCYVFFLKEEFSAKYIENFLYIKVFSGNLALP